MKPIYPTDVKEAKLREFVSPGTEKLFGQKLLLLLSEKEKKRKNDFGLADVVNDEK